MPQNMIGIQWTPCDPDASNSEDRLTIFYAGKFPETLTGEKANTILKAILRGGTHQAMTITFPDAASKTEGLAA